LACQAFEWTYPEAYSKEIIIDSDPTEKLNFGGDREDR
jgi:hypothetical protein